MLALLRAVIERRRVVACDLVELSPLPGVIAPNFLCAKLVYKILTYRFGLGSDRDQTGVRPGSDQGQTGIRPGSDRGQTGVRAPS